MTTTSSMRARRLNRVSSLPTRATSLPPVCEGLGSRPLAKALPTARLFKQAFHTSVLFVAAKLTYLNESLFMTRYVESRLDTARREAIA